MTDQNNSQGIIDIKIERSNSNNNDSNIRHFKFDLKCSNKNHVNEGNKTRMQCTLICIQHECTKSIFLCSKCITDKSCDNYKHHSHELMQVVEFLHRVSESAKFSVQSDNTNDEATVDNSNNMDIKDIMLEKNSWLNYNENHFAMKLNETMNKFDDSKAKLNDVYSFHVNNIISKLQVMNNQPQKFGLLKFKYLFDIADKQLKIEQRENSAALLKKILYDEENMASKFVNPNFLFSKVGLFQEFTREIIKSVENNFEEFQEKFFDTKIKGKKSNQPVNKKNNEIVNKPNVINDIPLVANTESSTIPPVQLSSSLSSNSLANNSNQNNQIETNQSNILPNFDNMSAEKKTLFLSVIDFLVKLNDNGLKQLNQIMQNSNFNTFLRTYTMVFGNSSSSGLIFPEIQKSTNTNNKPSLQIPPIKQEVKKEPIGSSSIIEIIDDEPNNDRKIEKTIPIIINDQDSPNIGKSLDGILTAKVQNGDVKQENVVNYNSPVKIEPKSTSIHNKSTSHTYCLGDDDDLMIEEHFGPCKKLRLHTNFELSINQKSATVNANKISKLSKKSLYKMNNKSYRSLCGNNHNLNYSNIYLYDDMYIDHIKISNNINNNQESKPIFQEKLINLNSTNEVKFMMSYIHENEEYLITIHQFGCLGLYKTSYPYFIHSINIPNNAEIICYELICYPICKFLLVADQSKHIYIYNISSYMLKLVDVYDGYLQKYNYLKEIHAFKYDTTNLLDRCRIIGLDDNGAFNMFILELNLPISTFKKFDHVYTESNIDNRNDILKLGTSIHFKDEFIYITHDKFAIADSYDMNIKYTKNIKFNSPSSLANLSNIKDFIVIDCLECSYLILLLDQNYVFLTKIDPKDNASNEMSIQYSKVNIKWNNMVANGGSITYLIPINDMQFGLVYLSEDKDKKEATNLEYICFDLNK